MTANSAIFEPRCPLGPPRSARKERRDVLRPAGTVKSAKQAQISGQTVAYPANAGKKVRTIVREDAVCRLFMSIPGVGPLTALVYKSAIDDPKRFAKSANVGVHLGLTPRKYASGEIDYNGRITKCGDPLTRNHLYEAASVLMRRSMKTSALKTWGTRIAKRGSMKKAYVAVARKLAVIMHRMWLDGTEFDFGGESAAMAP